MSWKKVLQDLVLFAVVPLLFVIFIHILIHNDEIRIVADVLIVAFTVLVLPLREEVLSSLTRKIEDKTREVKSEFNQRLTHDLLSGLVSTQGTIVKHAEASLSSREIRPGGPYTMRYRIIVESITQSFSSPAVTPRLRMYPRLFVGAMDDPSQDCSVWLGDTPKWVPDQNQWRLEGRISFDTSRLVTEDAKLDVQRVNLLLDFTGLSFDLAIYDVPVHLFSKAEILQHLIRLNMLKKLPPSHHVLRVSRSRDEPRDLRDIGSAEDCHTNIMFLSRLFEEIKQNNSEDTPLVTNIEASISHLIAREFRAIQEEGQATGRIFQLLKYRHKEAKDQYEEDLNCSDLLVSMLSLIPTPTRAEATNEVWVTLYQTSGFLAHVGQEPAICVFGFTSSTPKNVRVIFDLNSLTTADAIPNTHKMSQDELKQLAYIPERLFNNYAPTLLKKLQEPTTEQKIYNNLPPDKPLSDILSTLLPYARRSLRYGCFINSERALTDYWVNLGIFGRSLSLDNKQDVLGQAVYAAVDKLATQHNVRPDAGCILNLCTEESGIADELLILTRFRYKSYPTVNVRITSDNSVIMSFPESDPTEGQIVTLPKRFQDDNIKEEIILLVPFDSYVSKLEAVVREIRRHNNSIIGIITLFSTAKRWDYLSARSHFDIIPLFRIDDDIMPESLSPLTEMLDYKKLKPWLVT